MRCPPTYMLTPDIYLNYPTVNAVAQLLRLDVTAESSSGWNDMLSSNSAAVSARVRRFILRLKHHIVQFFMDLWFHICLFKSWRCEIFEVQKLQSSSQRPRRKHFEKLSFSISFKIEIFGSFVDFVLPVQTIKWAHRDAEATSERSTSAAIIISR